MNRLGTQAHIGQPTFILSFVRRPVSKDQDGLTGDPVSGYPSILADIVAYDSMSAPIACPRPFADEDGDRDVDLADFADFQRCVNGPGGVPPYDVTECFCWDHNRDGVIDDNDAAAFKLCQSGPTIPAQEDCGDLAP